ncbi:hypothetical protein [Methylotenera sp. N17]|uniref:hypothetical protein n=1 Tax=Methylotenera sp. N17 TaxID=1502761 RepID=UPI00046D67F2|nr:hypothetical protein [Methylotenera sp. N17]
MLADSSRQPQDTVKQNHTPARSSAHIKNLAALFDQHADDLQKWMEQVYISNPHELEKSTKVSAHEMADWVFKGPFNWKFDAIQELQAREALVISVSADFNGDRILAFITGTYTLLAQYYQGHHPLPHRKSLLEATQDIQVALNALVKNANNSNASLAISSIDYDAFTAIIHSIKSEIKMIEQ